MDSRLPVIGFIGNKNIKLGDKCIASGCEKRPHAKNYCSSHYAKYRRWGDGLVCVNDRRGKSPNSKKNLTYSIPIGNIPWNKGKHFMQGDKHPNWQGGKTDIKKRVRESLEYKNWRRLVFERDGYTCVFCGDNKGGNLEADHIKPFALFAELRFDINNGRTLCHNCHVSTETYGRKEFYYA